MAIISKIANSILDFRKKLTPNQKQLETVLKVTGKKQPFYAQYQSFLSTDGAEIGSNIANDVINDEENKDFKINFTA